MPKVSYRARREFAKEMLEHAFFGAFYLVIGARKNEDGLTRAQLGGRMGREKTGISKLLSGPRNWQLSTISDLSEALDVRVEFSLVDRHFPARRFTSTGVSYELGPSFTLNALPIVNMSSIHGQSGYLSATPPQGAIPYWPMQQMNVSHAISDTQPMTPVYAASTQVGTKRDRVLPAPALPPPGTAPAPTILGSMVVA